MTEATETKKTSLWKKWKNISEKVANFQGRVILEVLYFTIFLIPGVLVTLLSDRLRIKKPPKTWDEKEHKNIKDLSEAKEQ